MPYEYRQFTKTNLSKLKKFDQVDLYFYKTKSTGVGIKARFSVSKQSLPKSWNVQEVQLKRIRNYDEITSNKTIMQDWKKQRFNADFTVHSREYFLQEYKNSTMIEIDQRIQQHLKDIGRKIVTIIRKSQKIKAKHLQKNLDLKRWLETEDDLVEVYAILKQRVKGYFFQEGMVNVIPLFGMRSLQSEFVYKTKAFEHKKQWDLCDLLKKFETKPTENISYPSLLQKKYSRII